MGARYVSYHLPHCAVKCQYYAVKVVTGLLRGRAYSCRFHAGFQPLDYPIRTRAHVRGVKWDRRLGGAFKQCRGLWAAARVLRRPQELAPFDSEAVDSGRRRGQDAPVIREYRVMIEGPDGQHVDGSPHRGEVLRRRR